MKQTGRLVFVFQVSLHPSPVFDFDSRFPFSRVSVPGCSRRMGSPSPFFNHFLVLGAWFGPYFGTDFTKLAPIILSRCDNEDATSLLLINSSS